MNILTIDLEEWFHLLDLDNDLSESQWEHMEVRIHKNTDRILEFLDVHNKKATFFCVGWIADKYPEIIKKIDSLGFEIASHSHMHKLAYKLNKAEFDEDLLASLGTIENITGKKVTSYRAPGFSIKSENIWALESLIQHGIEIDCSIFPTTRAHGGMSGFPSNTPCIININGLQLKELPINTFNVLGYQLVFSGGGYFRFLPTSILNYLIYRSNYIMYYFHPRDFDSEQPILQGLSFYRKFKAYYGLRSAFSKFSKILGESDLIDIKYADSIIDWKNAKVIKL